MELKTWVEENLPVQFELESAADKVIVHMLENNMLGIQQNQEFDSYIW